MMELFAELDPASNAAIARMADPALLDLALINMLRQSVEDMQKAATDYMYTTFINPTGGAEEAWEIDVVSAELATLVNTAPQSRRLNFGFSGMTDALGRHFDAWPLAYPQGYHWAEAALDAVTPDIEDIFLTGFETTFGEIAG
jgi:hypothetical protein